MCSAVEQSVSSVPILTPRIKQATDREQRLGGSCFSPSMRSDRECDGTMSSFICAPTSAQLREQVVELTKSSPP